MHESPGFIKDGGSHLTHWAKKVLFFFTKLTSDCLRMVNKKIVHLGHFQENLNVGIINR